MNDIHVRKLSISDCINIRYVVNPGLTFRTMEGGDKVSARHGFAKISCYDASYTAFLIRFDPKRGCVGYPSAHSNRIN